MSDRAAPKGFRAAPVGPRAKDVRVVREGDLAAVVSDASTAEFDPTRANLTAHEHVVEEAFRRGEILPVRFGTVAGDDAEIKRFLRDKHDDLVRSLDRLRGRIELGVKVFWDRDRILAEIVEEDPEIRAMRDAIVTDPDTQSYDQRIELGRAVSEAIEEKRRSEGERIVEQLGNLAADVANNRLLAETMVLNAAFLVERDRLDAFDAAVSELGAEENGRLTFKYSGPLAPYDFVNIVVHKPRAA